MAVIGVKGFEIGSPAAYYSSTSGSPTAVTTTVRGSGMFSMKCPANAYGIDTLSAGVRNRTYSLFFNLDGVPAGASATLFSARNPNANMSVFVTVGGGISAQAGGGTAQTGGAISTSAWHRLDVNVDCSTGTYTVQWALDGVAQTNATVAATAADMTAVWTGNLGASGINVYIDDVVVASANGDYPLGAFHVLGYNPNIVGTHNTPVDFDASGTTLGGSATGYTSDYGADSGSGYMNSIGFDPNIQYNMAGSGDVWGLRGSEDGGNSWHGAMGGTHFTGAGNLQHGRAVEFSKHASTLGAKLYGWGSPNGGDASGEFGFSSYADGMYTTIDSTNGFGNASTGGSQNSNGKRCMGKLIQTDLISGTEYIYTITTNGLLRYTNTGNLATMAAPTVLEPASSFTQTNKFVDMCLFDSNHLLIIMYDWNTVGTGHINTALYMATSSVGNLATGSAANVTVSQLTGVPINNVYEVQKGNDGHYYAACGFDGIYEVVLGSSPTWLAWTHIATPDNQTASVTADTLRNIWFSQCGTSSSTFSSSSSNMVSGHGVGKIPRSGGTWGSIAYAGAASYVNKEFKPGDTTLATGRNFWRYGNTGPDFDSGAFDAIMVRIDPFDDTHIIVCGREGAFMTRDSGAHWQPATRGLNGSEVTLASTGPGDQVQANDTDAVAKNSTDAFLTCVRQASYTVGAVQHATVNTTGSTTLTGVDGATYVITQPAGTNPAQLTRNGVDITDNNFKWGCIFPQAWTTDSKGNVFIAQYSGTFVVRKGAAGGTDTTSWQAIDEQPPNTADYVEQQTASGTAYTEYGIEDSTEPSAMSYVLAIAALFSNSTGTNNAITKIRDGTTDSNVYSGSTTGTAVQYQTNFYTTKPSGGAWTLAAFNALLLRFGFATDVAPPPRLASFLLEAAYPDSTSVAKNPTADTLALSGDTATVSATGSGSVPITGTDQMTLLRDSANVVTVGQNLSSFQMSGLWGAGFATIVAPSPLIPGLVLCGGELCGIYRSTDDGDTWVAQNAEINQLADRSISDIAWHPTDKNRVFRTSGDGLTVGGFWESTDQGQTWIKRSSLPITAGNSHPLLISTGNDPKPVNKLIVADPVNGFVYVGTYNSGVYRATMTPGSGVGVFSLIALGPNATVGGSYYINTLIADSTDPDILYASTYINAAATEGASTLSGRVWRIAGASTATATVTEFTNSPKNVNDMVHLGSALFCVAYESATGDRGLWTLNIPNQAAGGVSRAANFNNWWNRVTAQPFTTEVWYAIDGILSGNDLTLYIVCDKAVSDGHGGYTCFFKLTDNNAGATLTQAYVQPNSFDTGGAFGSVQKRVSGNPSERDYWLFPRQPSLMFGQANYTPSCVAIDKSAATTTTGGGVTPIQGICDPNRTTIRSGYAGDVNALTVYVDWINLQPTSTSLLDGSDVTVIDNALTYAAANNIQIKVRLFAGGLSSSNTSMTPTQACAAPAWLRAQTGTFLHKNAQDASKPLTAIAKFWTSAYKTAYDNLVSLLAARYDGNAHFNDITISGAMMIYAEPFIRDIGASQNLAELVGGGIGWNGTNIPVPGAGYTDALNITAHEAFIDSHAAHLNSTCSSLTFNPYQRIDSITSTSSNDVAKRRTVLQYFKNALGTRGVIENNSLRPDYFTYDAQGNPTGFSTAVPSYTTMFQDHVTYQPPYFYQTANSTQITNSTYTTVQSALKATVLAADQILFANALEPSSGASMDTAAVMGTYNQLFIANPLPAAGGTGGTITVYPNKARVWVSGDAIWRTANADDATANVVFNPVVHALGLTVNRRVLTDPNTPANVYIANEDYGFIWSADSGTNVDQNVAGFTQTDGLSLTTNETTSPTTVYIGVGNRLTNTGGEVYSNPNPTGAGTWSSTNLGLVAGGAQPTGLLYLKDASNNDVLIAAVGAGTPDNTNVTKAGLYRKVGLANWVKLTNITPSGIIMLGQLTRSAQLKTRRTTSQVYLFDGATGVWRSNDYGVSWTRIYSDTADNSDYRGYVSVHPTDSTTIYISTAAGIFQINNADTVGQDLASPIDISGGIINGPGVLKVTSGGIITLGTRPAPPGLWRSSIATPSVWSEIDDGVYQDVARFAQDLEVDPTGRAYIATNGDGIVENVQTSASDLDTLTFTAENAVVSTGAVRLSGSDVLTFSGDNAGVSITTGTAVTLKKWIKDR